MFHPNFHIVKTALVILFSVLLSVMYTGQNAWASDLTLESQDIQSLITAKKFDQALDLMSQQSQGCLLYTSPSPRDRG